MVGLTAGGEVATGDVVGVAPAESGPAAESRVAVTVLVEDGEFTEEITEDGCVDVERSRGLGGLEVTKYNLFLPSAPILH